MALREGYLDVIDEMTTGTDLVSKLLPDAQRGIVALHEMRSIATGDPTAGALRRGFVSITPFAADMDISRAPRYTPQGFTGGTREGVLARHLQILKEEGEREQRLGPGMFAGMRGQIEKSTILEGGKPAAADVNQMDVKASQGVMVKTNYLTIMPGPQGAVKPGAPVASGVGGYWHGAAGKAGQSGLAGGGIIPGFPSDRDNMMGLIDGKHPVGLASGEFVINARAAQRHRFLLEAINESGSGEASGWGLAGGGRAVAASMKRWKGASEAHLKWGVRRGMPGAREALVEYYREKRGFSEAQARNAVYGADVRSTFSSAMDILLQGGAGGIASGVKFVGDVAGGIAAAASPEGLISRAAPYTPPPPLAAPKEEEIEYEAPPWMVEGGKKPRWLAEASKKWAAQEKAYRDSERTRVLRERARAHIEKVLGPLGAAPGDDVSSSSYTGRKGTQYRGTRIGDQWIITKDARTHWAGMAQGGMLDPYGLSAAQALTISGGMRIGTLNLNGKTIGQDISGGMGDEWKAAMKDAYG
jgi:hypothetical protein